MRRSTKALLSLALAAALSASLSAQWPLYSTAGVRKTADGKPDLNAPAPRTADGKIDLSGIWENQGGFGRDATPPVEPAGVPPLAMFWNVGAGFKEGLPFRRPTYGTLDVEITVNDPRAYTRPWTVRVNQKIMLDQEPIEFICNENERDTPHFAK